MKKWLILFCLWVFASEVFAYALLEIEAPKKAHEGTAFKVYIRKYDLPAEFAPEFCSADFLGKRYRFYKPGENKDAEAVLAVPLGAKVGASKILVDCEGLYDFGTGHYYRSANVYATAMVFPSAVFKFKALSALETRRHAAESKEINNATSSYSVVIAPSVFIWPISGGCFVTSQFGAKRLNGKKQIIGRHYGTDCKASEGTTVYAVADGFVTFGSDTLLGGKTLILNHGYGVFSVYMHLSEFVFSSGVKYLQAGQPIARVGKSGRASGSHLHFAIKVNGIYVDPIEFLKMGGAK